MIPSAETIRELIDQSERMNREIVYVEFDDGSHEILALGRDGGFFSLNLKRVKFIFHTHLLPRFTPSIADIMTAYKASKVKGKPVPFYTACKVNDEIIIYEISIKPTANIEEIINDISVIEEVIEQDVIRYSRVQHYKMLTKRGLSITRYRLKYV